MSFISFSSLCGLNSSQDPSLVEWGLMGGPIGEAIRGLEGGSSHAQRFYKYAKDWADAKSEVVSALKRLQPIIKQVDATIPRDQLLLVRMGNQAAGSDSQSVAETLSSAQQALTDVRDAAVPLREAIAAILDRVSVVQQGEATGATTAGSSAQAALDVSKNLAVKANSAAVDVQTKARLLSDAVNSAYKITLADKLDRTIADSAQRIAEVTIRRETVEFAGKPGQTQVATVPVAGGNGVFYIGAGAAILLGLAKGIRK